MPKPPLYYTFGNHMHWVDMQWLWGYGVLPGSVRDMLTLCREARVKGNVNFDGIGYEKMACDSPDALAELREAVKQGIVEPVGCSYGQPYGLFHGGESNVRQLTYGVRSVLRHLGVRARTFWEEEFYFFPQLPQMLAQCGFTGACLFFQWTWHTPEVPKEPCSLILWEGIDGTRLPTLPRNELNVHQWPEDFDGLLDGPRVNERKPGELPPAVVQWLELMPTKDWMCRSELLLPRLKALMDDKRFDVRACTAGELIAHLLSEGSPERKLGSPTASIPVRAYTMDDVWHGMTIGKNADAHPRASRRVERTIQSAESLSALSSLFGRPYASWDAYPAWELDEAWRDALAAQHHDNHECEGLCGFVGHQQFEKARQIGGEVAGRAAWLLTRRAGAKHATDLLHNSLGWSRLVLDPQGKRTMAPPFGFAQLPSGAGRRRGAVSKLRKSRGIVTLSRGELEVSVDTKTGVITRISHFGREFLGNGASLFSLAMKRGEKPVKFGVPTVTISEDPFEGHVIQARYSLAAGEFAVSYWLAASLDAVDVHVRFYPQENPIGNVRPDPGLAASLQAMIRPGHAFRVIADSPYAVHQVSGSGVCRRKYPVADWMTSPQWFETIENPFTAATFADLVEERSGHGLHISHDGAQGWFHGGDHVRCVLTAYDPWDEGRYTGDGWFGVGFRITPHAGLTHAERVKVAAEITVGRGLNDPYIDEDAQPVGGGTASGVKKDIPPTFGALEVEEAPGVLAHAFYRDNPKSGEGLPNWAGHRMFADSEGGCDHPFVTRLVEWNGEPANVILKFPGKVAAAAKTTILGEVGPDLPDTAWLKPEKATPPTWAKNAKLKGKPITWSQVRFTMRPREIATIYADLVMGRKEWRDLDAKRKVWAKVHRDKLPNG
jgi:alpha-mannosidase